MLETLDEHWLHALLSIVDAHLLKRFSIKLVLDVLAVRLIIVEEPYATYAVLQTHLALVTLCLAASEGAFPELHQPILPIGNQSGVIVAGSILSVRLIVDHPTVACQAIGDSLESCEFLLIRVYHLRLPIRHSHATDFVKICQNLMLHWRPNVALLYQNPDVDEPGIALLDHHVFENIEPLLIYHSACQHVLSGKRGSRRRDALELIRYLLL